MNFDKMIMSIFSIAIIATLIPQPVEASKPFFCPIDGQRFATYDELVAHYQQFHPGERIPIEIHWS